MLIKEERMDTVEDIERKIITEDTTTTEVIIKEVIIKAVIIKEVDMEVATIKEAMGEEAKGDMEVDMAVDITTIMVVDTTRVMEDNKGVVIKKTTIWAIKEEILIMNTKSEKKI